MITRRLQLVPTTVALCRAEVQGRDAIGRALGAHVPASWPPPVFETDDVERIHRQLDADPTNRAWTLHYVLLPPATLGEQAKLVGVAGYAGPPAADGIVNIGYAIAAEHQGRGYATEAVGAIVAQAFLDPRVEVVCATTYPTLGPSLSVLRKTGFAHVTSDPGSGVVTYERRRPQSGTSEV
jgi:RimJ/RimL family protein N-acetyltransferase